MAGSDGLANWSLDAMWGELAGVAITQYHAGSTRRVDSMPSWGRSPTIAVYARINVIILGD